MQAKSWRGTRRHSVPRKSKTRESSPLDAINDRIREAEAKLAPVSYERIGLDMDAVETVAVLVERGHFGKKPDVLRRALAAGLRALRAGTDPQDEPLTITGALPKMVTDFESEIDLNAPIDESPKSALLAGALGQLRPTGAPILDPPPKETGAEVE